MAEVLTTKRHVIRMGTCPHVTSNMSSEAAERLDSVLF
jgi:hypothetical protein